MEEEGRGRGRVTREKEPLFSAAPNQSKTGGGKKTRPRNRNVKKQTKTNEYRCQCGSGRRLRSTGRGRSGGVQEVVECLSFPPAALAAAIARASRLPSPFVHTHTDATKNESFCLHPRIRASGALDMRVATIKEKERSKSIGGEGKGRRGGGRGRPLPPLAARQTKNMSQTTGTPSRICSNAASMRVAWPCVNIYMHASSV